MGRGPLPNYHPFHSSVHFKRPNTSETRKKFLKFLIYSEERRSIREGRKFFQPLLDEAIFAAGISEREVELIRKEARSQC